MKNQQSSNLINKFPVNEYFIYYAYLTPFLKNRTFSCSKNALHVYPPEMTRNALDNPNCSNVLHQFLTNPEFSIL